MLEGVIGRMVSPVFVGREHELSVLGEAFEQAHKQAASAVLLGGEAGGGKTRLVAKFSETVAQDGAHVLTGGCVELSTEGLAYAAFTAAFRELVREAGTEDIAALLPEGAASDLARLLPEFGAAPADTDSATARARLFEQVLMLLERLAERRPVVLIVEDAHWADRSSRDLFAFLARNLGSAPVLLIMTYRSDELHRSHPLRPVLAELSRMSNVVRVDLPRMTRYEVAAQIAGILGQAPSASLIEDVYGRSDGIPLFVEALVECEGKCSFPDSVHDLIIGSVERLPEETQRVLRVAAAGGTRVGHGLLATVTELDDSALEEALRPAVANNVLVIDHGGYAFRHALIREAVHDELLPGEHTRLHTRYAEEIEANRRLVPPGRAAIEIAHHWYAARDNTWALISAWEAAKKADKALAYAEAVQLLERVLVLWEKVPDAAKRIGADHTEVLELAAECAFAGGEVDLGMKFVNGALCEVDPEGEPERVAILLVRRSQLKGYKGKPGELEDLLAAAALVTRPSEARAFVLTRLGAFLHLQGRVEESLPLTEEALSIARELGDDHLECDLIMNAALAKAYDGKLEESLELLDRARAMAEALDEGEGCGRLQLRATINQVDALTGLGRAEEAARLAKEGLKLARKFGRYRTQGLFLLTNLAEALEALGRWAEAVDALEEGLASGPVRNIEGYLLRMRVELGLYRGEIELADKGMTRLSMLLDGPDLLEQERLGFARLTIDCHNAVGNTAGALAVVEETLAEQTLSSKADLVWPLLIAMRQACDAAVGSDLAERAAPLLAQVVRDAERLAARGADLGPVAEAYRLSFAEDWDNAAAAWEAVGRPYPRARALRRAAEMRARAGDRDGVAVRLRVAYSIAAELGARPLQGEIDALARRAGVSLADTPSSAATPATQEPFGLTPRELEVLRLVAEGRTNREIASELFISAKTVSVHVSNMLAKLGVSTRGEAAAAAHRHGLLAPVIDTLPA